MAPRPRSGRSPWEARSSSPSSSKPARIRRAGRLTTAQGTWSGGRPADPRAPVAGIDSTAGRGRQCLSGWAAEKVAGGVCAGHRVGVVDAEDQGKVERVGTGGQGFVQDAIAPDLFEGDAVTPPAWVMVPA